MTLARRIALVLAALALAFVALRDPIAAAILTRGDLLAAQNALPEAAARYRLAAAIARNDSRPAERLAFTLYRQRDPGALREAVTVADARLRVADDGALRLDRALALRALARHREAAIDFDALAARTGDLRYIEFAARSYLAAGDRQTARERFAAVVRRDPHFSPAVRALRALAS